MVGNGPAGVRLVVEVESMHFTSDRLRGELVGGAAADWVTVVGTVGTLDVRATIRTDDGAIVFTHYQGRMDLSNGPGTSPIYVAPVFETGDERYAWLNTVQAVGKGTVNGTELVYEWYEVV